MHAALFIPVVFPTKCLLFQNCHLFFVQIIYFIFLYASSYSFIPHFLFYFSFLPIDRTALFKAISSHSFTHTLTPICHITIFSTWLILLRKAVCNKTKRKTKSEMAGWRVHGPEKDGNKRMERQSKGSRSLEAYCKGGQGPPRAVAPPKKKTDTSTPQMEAAGASNILVPICQGI